MNSVKDCLKKAGLDHLTPLLGGLSIETFRTLLLQDFDRYGIVEMTDKQAVFRLIQELNAEDLSVSIGASDQINSLAFQEVSSPAPGQAIKTDSMRGKYQAVHERIKEITAMEQSNTEAFDLSHVDSAGAEEDLLDLDASGSDDADFLGDDDIDIQAFSEAFIRSATPETMLDNNGIGRHVSDADPSVNDKVVEGNAGQVGVQNFLESRDTNEDDNHALRTANLRSICDPPRIRVIVRKRPLNNKEIERGDTDVLECDTDAATLYVHEPKTKVDLTRFTECHEFRFDDVFDENVGNESLYCRAVQPLIATLFRRGRGTCFAYGQTGSGKTYTMQPLPLRAAADIFRVMKKVPDFSSFSLHVSCFEIYGGRIFDLLNSRERLEVREDGKRQVRVVGLKEIEVNNLETLNELCTHAACARSTGTTGANDESSRSHSILTFVLRSPGPAAAKGPEKITKSQRLPPAQRNAPPQLKIVGKLSFIDLAGSERGADTFENDKQTRLEGAEINKSLLALKECIRALDMEAGHIPFRGSKLTSVLRDSFMGKNARTVMIANVSPNSSSCEHTINTLRYADRVKEIKKESGNVGGRTSILTGSGLGKKTTKTFTNNDADSKTKIKEDSLSVDDVAAILQNLPPPSFPANQPMSDLQICPSRPSAVHVPSKLKLGSDGASPDLSPLSPDKRSTPGSMIPSMKQTKAKAGKSSQPLSQAPLLSPGKSGALRNGSTTPKKGSRKSISTIASPNSGRRLMGKPINKIPGKNNDSSLPVQERREKKFISHEPAIPQDSNQDNRDTLSAHPLNEVYSDSQTSTGVSDRQERTVSLDSSGHKANHSTKVGVKATEHNGIDEQSHLSEAVAALLAAEDDLITAHKEHIENAMTGIRAEMDLLARLDDSDGNGLSIEAYIEELNDALMDRSASIASLLQQVTNFRRQLRIAMAEDRK